MSVRVMTDEECEESERKSDELWNALTMCEKSSIAGVIREISKSKAINEVIEKQEHESHAAWIEEHVKQNREYFNDTCPCEHCSSARKESEKDPE